MIDLAADTSKIDNTMTSTSKNPKSNRFIISRENTEHFDQLAIAETICTKHKLRVNATGGHFLQWSPAHMIWEPISLATVRGMVRAFLAELVSTTKSDTLRSRCNGALISAIARLVADVAIKHTEPDFSKGMLPVQNGVLNLADNTPSLLKHSEGHGFSWLMPASWTPKKKPVRFLAELLKPAVSADDLSLLKRALGSFLLPGNKAQFILLLVGQGGTGKSTLATIIEQILTWNRIAHLRTAHLGARFESNAYHGKDLLVGKDVPSSFLTTTSAGHLKSLTGSDMVETERKFGGKATLSGNFNILITANSLPRIALDSDAEAWERRLIVIEFKRTVGRKRTANFAGELLAEEADGILSWLVEGYLEAKREIESDGFISLTQEQKARRADMVRCSASVESFVDEQIERRAKSTLPSSELYGRYLQFCQCKQWVPETDRAFQIAAASRIATRFAISKRHDIQHNGKQVRGYVGVGFLPDTPRKPASPVKAKTSRPKKTARRKHNH